MRDDRDFKETFLISTESYTRTNPENVTTFISSSKSQKTRTRRSDSTSTIPNSAGIYYRPTNYQGIFSFCSSGPGSCTYVRRNSAAPNNPNLDTINLVEWEGLSVGSTWRYGVSAVSLTPSVPTSVISGARNSVLSQIRDSDLHVGLLIGEIRESVSTISSLLSDAVKLLRSLRRPVRSLSAFSISQVRRDMRNGTIPKRVAREYLRYMYGIKPIVSDAYAIANGLVNGFTDTPILVAGSRLLNPNFGPHLVPGNVPGKIWYTGKAEQGVEVVVHFALSNPTMYQLWRYGVTNPLSLAWELTTLSFVVDWFTGIGNFLDSLQQPLGLRYLHGYETTFTDLMLVGHELWYKSRVSPHLTYVVEEGIGTNRIQTLCFKRTFGVGFPVPLPYWKMELNLSQIASSLAILTSYVK